MKRIFYLAVTILIAAGNIASAQNADVVGGQTSVLLDTDLLSAAAGLDLSGVSSDVGAGSLGDGSVAFDINPRDAASLPTTFSYTVGDLSPFSGAIEHTGSVFFNNDTVEVGNFTIGFDANRVAGANSGFFVESTTGVSAILFDVADVSKVAPTATALTVGGSLAVSPEFASFLGDTGLTGATVGLARVEGISAIPEPSTALAISLLGLCAVVRRIRH